MRQVHRGHTPHAPYDQCLVQVDSLREGKGREEEREKEREEGREEEREKEGGGRRRRG